jgi:3'-phosphoadenosine 5'-phosphosulfate sulfotransferase (PAPS reductase)/FAD synthetase
MSNHIVSFSGGKDSTALLLMMLDKGMQVDDIVFCDTGMEFDEMYNHIDKVEKQIKRTITRLISEKGWDYYMFEHIKTKGKNMGSRGYSFPTPLGRWCTDRLKQRPFKKYIKDIDEPTIYIGIASDERKRIKDNGEKYPLVDWEVSEKDALEYCYSKGFDWGGLYEKFSRVSCWCCPLQNINSLRSLYHDFPEKWEVLKEMQRKSSNDFRYKYSVFYYDKKFKKEDAHNTS